MPGVFVVLVVASPTACGGSSAQLTPSPEEAGASPAQPDHGESGLLKCQGRASLRPAPELPSQGADLWHSYRQNGAPVYMSLKEGHCLGGGPCCYQANTKG